MLAEVAEHRSRAAWAMPDLSRASGRDPLAAVRRTSK
jgi:hypothetical protein